MSLTVMGWLFTIGVLMHNAEEAMFLPRWSSRAGWFHRPVTAEVFRIAVIMLSAIFVVITAAASLSRAASPASYLMGGYVLAMVLNVLFPHVCASVLVRKYMPGTATALLLNLPLGVMYLHRALAVGSVTRPTFYWAGPAVVLATMALLPGLFAVGRKLHVASR
ncbi:MAG: HXXEE domain-containing protein [Rhodanobacter sp.]